MKSRRTGRTCTWAGSLTEPEITSDHSPRFNKQAGQWRQKKVPGAGKDGRYDCVAECRGGFHFGVLRIEIAQRERTMWQIGHSTGQFRRSRGAITIFDGVGSTKQACLTRERSCSTRKKSNEVAMTAINKQPGRHEIEELLPWYARGTLSGRDAERVEQALAGDRELARRYELVRRELAETTRLNEALGAPSARAREKLFAAINAEEARAPRRRRRPISRTRFLASTRDSALTK